MGYDDENDLNDLELEEPGTPEHSRIYDLRYVRQLKTLTEGKPAEEVDEIIKEMETLSYTPSNRPETDAEINWMKSQIAQKKKQHQFTKDELSFLQHTAQEDGISLAEAKRQALEFLPRDGADSASVPGVDNEYSVQNGFPRSDCFR